MGGHRLVIAAVALLVVVALAADAAEAFRLEREGRPIRALIPRGPVPLSGAVAHGPSSAPAAPPENATVWEFGQEYRVTRNPAAQNEVGISVSPANPGNLVSTANDYRGVPGLPGDVWCGAYTTLDGGRTWTEQLVPRTGALVQATAAGDPSVAFDASGDAYVTCLGFSRSTDDNVIGVSKSLDGGRTWGPSVAVISVNSPNEFHDKPYMAVDTISGSPYAGAVYVTWTKFMTGTECGSYNAAIYFSRSLDGGLTYSVPMDISLAGYSCSQGSQPSVGPGGELYVSWVNYIPGGQRVVVAKSTDAGLTWGKSVVALVSPVEDIFGGSPRTPHFPSLAANPVPGPSGTRVHVGWTDRRFGSPDIVMSTTDDGGTTWTFPVKVNNDTGSAAQFFPWVAAADNGRVDVVFYDRRDDPGGRGIAAYVATSYDFGTSFRNRKASAVFDPGTWFIGDYIGIDSNTGSSFPVWCDLRNGGEEEVYMGGPPVITRLLPPRMGP